MLRNYRFLFFLIAVCDSFKLPSSCLFVSHLSSKIVVGRSPPTALFFADLPGRSSGGGPPKKKTPKDDVIQVAF